MVNVGLRHTFSKNQVKLRMKTSTINVLRIKNHVIAALIPFINDNQTTIQNNRSAWQIELKSNPDKTFFYVLTINNGYGYVFGYAAKDNSRFDTYLKDFKNMINSVVFNSTTSKKIPSFMKNKDTANQSLSLLGNDNSNDQSSDMTANANIKTILN